MYKKIIECVPNFSEGRDMTVIFRITEQILSVEGVRLLNVDPGKDTNRTVVTFAGGPEEVCEAAFRAVKKASELIDMSKHTGKHPRIGATDVCPLVPVSGISMEETVFYARKLAERIGNELLIPVYCYGKASFEDKRRDLAYCRAGEYEGLAKKLTGSSFRPDFGPAVFNKRSGATVVGARDFLVAFNINLNTKSVYEAKEIANDIRERGRPLREGDPFSGRIMRDEQGNTLRVPGTLKCVKAIGWYIEEYGFAQVSMNLTDISVTPVHKAFTEVSVKAASRGLKVTGSELIGMIPLKAMLEAGRYFQESMNKPADLTDGELIKTAVSAMGLSMIREFKPEEKILEYVLSGKINARLADLDLKRFIDAVASGSPLPGGGSVMSYIGALGVALGTMTANLSGKKHGMENIRLEFTNISEKGAALQKRLLELVDEDVEAYNRIIEAYSLPKNSEEELQTRKTAIHDAFSGATLVQMKVMETAFKGLEVLKEMVEKGMPASVPDAAAGTFAILACLRGAFLNIRINLRELNDKKFADEIIKRAGEIESIANDEEKRIIRYVETRFGI